MTTPKIFLHQNDLPSDIILQGDTLAIDTETMGLDLKRDRLCLIQIKDVTNNIHLIQFVDRNYQAPNLKKYLQDIKINKIFHYARFDIAAIYIYLGVLCSNIFCTKIASKLSRTYTDKHSLQFLCKELLAVDLTKAQQISNWGNRQLTQKQQLYAASDVLYLHALKEELLKLLEQENRLTLAQSCFKFLPTRVLLDWLNFTDDKEIFKH